MKQINWIIQGNLIDNKTFEGLKKAITADNALYQQVYIIPFSDEMDIAYNNDFINIFYGTTTLIMNASKIEAYGEAIFFDNDRFQMRRYLSEWDGSMLNSDGRVLTIAEFTSNDNDEFFIRPNEDTKSFSGYVTTFADFKEKAVWADGQNPYYHMNSLILVCNPKQIEKEWRNIIVKGEVISSSRYSIYGQKAVDPNDVPDGMIRFTENCCKIYTPHDVFVIDIALCEDKYYIIECNCFNDSGFYDHDIEKIVGSINKYIEKKIT